MSKEVQNALIPYDNSLFMRLVKALQGIKNVFNTKKDVGTSFPVKVIEVLKIEVMDAIEKARMVRERTDRALKDLRNGKTLKLNENDFAKLAVELATNVEGEKEKMREYKKAKNAKQSKETKQPKGITLSGVRDAIDEKNQER